MRAYEASIKHFESWGGFLPATNEQLSKYIASFENKLSKNTLALRVGFIKRWNKSHGFDVPSVAPQKQNQNNVKRANPINIEEIEKVASYLSGCDEISHKRDKAFILLGFWRGFRSDELVRVTANNVLITDEGITITLPHSKESANKISFFLPRLKSLCAVSAVEEWLAVSGLQQGPLFRSINRWGKISEDGLHVNSVIPLLRSAFRRAGIDAERYSSHSLRRGFATWASQSGWDIHSIMNYIGWKTADVAAGYIQKTQQYPRFE